MREWIGPLTVLPLIAASLTALFGCVRLYRRGRRRAVRTAVKAVQSRIGGQGIWTGAWLVGIPRARARRALEKGSSAARSDEPPEHVLDVWHAEGGAPLGHVAGPLFSTEADAGAWVKRASDELAGAPVAWPNTDRAQSVFALVYASAAAPPSRASSLMELRDGLFGESCMGVAFIACPDGAGGARAATGDVESQLASSQGALRALAAALWVLGALVLVSAGYAGVAVASGAESWRRFMSPDPSTGGCEGTAQAGTGVVPGPVASAGTSTTPSAAPASTDSGPGEQTTTSEDGRTGDSPRAATSGDAGAGDAGEASSTLEDAGDAGGAELADAGAELADAGAAEAGRGASTGAVRGGKRPTVRQGSPGRPAPAPGEGDTYDTPSGTKPAQPRNR